MFYKYTWTPSFKGLITDFDSLRALTDLSFGDSPAGNPWVQADMYRLGRGQLRR